MDTVIERCAGLDVHQDTVVVCVRVPGPDGGRQQLIQTFGTTTTAVLALRDWLTAQGVTIVGMESTGGTGSRSTTCSRTRWSAGC